MFSNSGSGGNLHDVAYSASPTNTARSRGKQVRSDDGFHSRPVRNEQSRRRKIAIALAASVCVIGAIFVLRATGDREERLEEVDSCAQLYEADICELIETP